MQENNTPLVSVLMTAYNREKYIAQAIESVLASSYQNFELIIVDDGSKDKTVEIATNYSIKDSRVKIYVNLKNMGDYPNRNQAACYAKGKYLKYVDADDLIYPWGLDVLVNCMEMHPEAGWGLCSLEQNNMKKFPFLLTPKEIYEYEYFGNRLFHKAPLSSIIKKQVFEEVGGFKPLRMAGDFEMWNRLGQKYNCVLMPHGVVWYRKHNEQEMTSYRKFIEAYESIKVSYLKSESCPLEKHVSFDILRRERVRIRKNIVKALMNFRYFEFLDNVKKIKAYKENV